jgi:hypothetical protein
MKEIHGYIHAVQSIWVVCATMILKDQEGTIITKNKVRFPFKDLQVARDFLRSPIFTSIKE